jgi:hypothetical protein
MTTAVAVVVASLAIFAGAALAADPGTDFRISTTGPDGDTRQGAFNPAVAYNSTNNEYLVVWYGDPDTRFEYEIWGQRIDATSGDLVTPPIRISNVGTDGDTTRIAQDAAVAWDSSLNRYLVVWYGNTSLGAGTPLNHFEIWGQVLEANGTEVGGDFRISTTGANTSQTRAALRPAAVTYNDSAGQYFVVWSGNPNTAQNFNHYDIYGQIVSNSGALVSGNVPVSQVGTNAPFDRSAFFPDVAYNSIDNEYVVVWFANDLPNSNEYEIWGQRMTAGGVEVGNDDFRVSNVGTDGDGLRDTGTAPPSIAYNSIDNEYLVTWYGDGLSANDDYEIFGQRLSAAGTQVPDSIDLRISNEGPEGSTGYGAFDPAAVYNPVDNEYLVAWYGNTGSEIEICGQRVSNTGAEVGSDFRLSNAGADGDTTREAFFTDVAFNRSPAGPNEYMAIWYGDGLETNDEFEVFGRRVGGSGSPCVTTLPPGGGGGGGGGGTPAPPAPSPPPPGGNERVVTLTLSGASTQRGLRAKAILVRAACDQACTVTASGSLTIPGASKTYRLRSVKRSLAAGKRVSLRLKLSSKVIRTARRALRKRKRVRATVRLTAQNSSGKKTSRKVIRITG